MKKFLICAFTSQYRVVALQQAFSRVRKVSGRPVTSWLTVHEFTGRTSSSILMNERNHEDTAPTVMSHDGNGCTGV